MTAVVGSPALRLLARRKLVGLLRSQARRLKRPSGLLLALLGLSLFGGWVLMIQFSPGGERLSRDPEDLVPVVRIGALFLTLFTIGSSVTHRGLFLPKEEIERLFSAPVSRADVVRYRLLTNAGRSAFAGLIFGLILMNRMPSAPWAFLGLIAGMQTLPIVGQASAILAGGLEKRSLRRLGGWPGGIVRALCFVLGMAVFFALFFGGAGSDTSILGKASELIRPAALEKVLDHPALAALTLPFEPWARAITAPDAAAFWPWFGLCVVLWLALFEGTARLPIDFRELSLETSANVAERIRRHRRAGGGASASTVSKLTLAWRVPWVFGRGPGGAIAWRKAVGIVRKARGTLLVSVFVLAIVTLLVATIIRGGGTKDVVGGAVLIVVAGTFYLAAGLRFDFREDLDRMEAIKAWPHSPSRVFAATVIPEALLVSGLLAGGVLLRAAATRTFDPWLVLVLAAAPLFVFAWIALDNAVFLLAPVRFVPGQEGAMQNAGRTVVLMLLRGVLLAVVGALVGGGYLAGFLVLEELLGAPHTAAVVGGAVCAWGALLACDLLLVAVGGLLFRRFDVTRV